MQILNLFIINKREKENNVVIIPQCGSRPSPMSYDPTVNFYQVKYLPKSIKIQYQIVIVTCFNCFLIQMCAYFPSIFVLFHMIKFQIFKKMSTLSKLISTI